MAAAHHARAGGSRCLGFRTHGIGRFARGLSSGDSSLRSLRSRRPTTRVKGRVGRRRRLIAVRDPVRRRPRRRWWRHLLLLLPVRRRRWRGWRRCGASADVVGRWRRLTRSHPIGRRRRRLAIELPPRRGAGRWGGRLPDWRALPWRAGLWGRRRRGQWWWRWRWIGAKDAHGGAHLDGAEVSKASQLHTPPPQRAAERGSHAPRDNQAVHVAA